MGSNPVYVLKFFYFTIKISYVTYFFFVKLYREHRQSVISDSTTASCITEVRGPSFNIESEVGSKQGNLLRGIVNWSFKICLQLGSDSRAVRAGV